MATQLQIRRGTSTQVAAFTGAEGEIVVNTTNDSVHVNDGSTAGGFEMARADLNNVSDTSLNAALTGNTVSALTVTALTSSGIDVTGTVTADGLTVDGNVSVVSALPRIILKENDVTDLNAAIRNNGGVFKIQTVNDAANSFTNRMDINHSSGDIILHGSVGIGTSDVNRALEIAGNNNGGAKANYIRITDTDTSATANNQQGGIEFFTNDSPAGIAASMEVLYAGSGGGGEITFNTNVSSGGTLTEALRIDENQSLLVGTSVAHLTSSTFSGYTQFAGGHSIQKRSGGIVAYYDRLTDDGDIMQFRRQGTTVGSIQSRAGVVSTIILDPRTNGAGLTGSTNGLIPVNQAGSTADNHVDLGSSSSRFKDLYLSGNVNIINPSEDERGLSITDQQDGGQNLKFLYNASSNVGRVINDNVDELRFNGAQGAMINTPSFSAISASDQTTVTNSTAQKINFGTQLSDTAGGHYATSTSRFTAPHDGTYFFSANISYKGGDGVDDTMYISYYINGADSLNRKFIDNWRASSGSGIERVGTYTLLLPLSADDYVELFYSGTAYAITMIGRYTKFSGFAVSLT